MKNPYHVFVMVFFSLQIGTSTSSASQDGAKATDFSSAASGPMAAAAQEQAPAGNERSVSLQKIDDFLSDRSVSSYLLGEGLTKEVILERVGLASDQQIAEAAAKVEAFRLARAERQREEPPQDAREREAKVKMMDSGADLLQATTVLTWIMIVMGVLLILLIL